MGMLQNAMRKWMETQGYSKNSIDSYISHVRLFATHFGKSPLTISSDEIESYFHILRKQNRSESSLNLCYVSLRLFFRINGISDRMPNLKFKRVRCKIPRVLSQQKVVTMLRSCRSLKYRTLFTLVYSAGLRLSELRNLMIQDLEFDRRQVFIKNSKNRKSRYSILGDETVRLLKNYINIYRPDSFLFYNQKDTSTRISAGAIGREFKKLVESGGIKSDDIHLHTLRHCFATHLVENGTSVFHIMHLLGHTSLQTTIVYLHAQNMHRLNITSPIDIPLDLPPNNTDLQQDLFSISA